MARFNEFAIFHFCRLLGGENEQVKTETETEIETETEAETKAEAEVVSVLCVNIPSNFLVAVAALI